MDPVTIIALVSAVLGLTRQAYELLREPVQDLFKFFQRRKRKTNPVDRLVQLQDPQEQGLEKVQVLAEGISNMQGSNPEQLQKQLAQLQAELQQVKSSAGQQQHQLHAQAQLVAEYQGKLQLALESANNTASEKEALQQLQQELLKQVRQLKSDVEHRDQEVSAKGQQAADYRKKWEVSVGSLKHLNMPLLQLLEHRREGRKSLCPYPEMDPDEWRFVVVLGPAGKGKSSFIRDQLESLGYHDLAQNVIVRTIGTGTTSRPAPYLLHRHKVLLLDSIGDAANINVLQGEAACADVLLVFMADGGRGEQMHGDAAVLGWRLHTHMHTAFVVPKFDDVLRNSRRDRSVHDVFDAAKHKVGTELHRQLIVADSSVAARAAAASLLPAQDVQLLLNTAVEHSADSLSCRLRADHWYSVWCYSNPRCFFDDGKSTARSFDQPDEEPALEGERQALVAVMYGRHMATSSSSGAVDQPPKTLTAMQQEMQLTQHSRAEEQAGLLADRLKPYLEAKLDKEALTLPECVVLLTSSSAGVQLQAARGLMRLLDKAAQQSSDALHRAQAEACLHGAIPGLVPLLESTDAVSSETGWVTALYAMGALINLCIRGNRQAVSGAVSANAVPGLLRMLLAPTAGADTMRLVQWASDCLLLLTYQCAPGSAAVGQHLRLLQKPPAKEFLLNMAAYCGPDDTNTKVAAVQAGAIDVMKHCQSSLAEDAEVQTEICWAVRNLAAVASIKPRLLDAALLQDMERLSFHSNSGVTAAAAEALQALLEG